MAHQIQQFKFQLKETPFGLDIKIKKRFVQNWPPIYKNASGFSQAHVPQNFPHHHVPSAQSFPNAQCDPNPQSFSNFDPATESKEKVPSKDYSEIINQSARLRQTLIDIQMDKDNSEKEYTSLEKSYRKLAKESKELQMKHEKICVSLKKLKNEKNQISKDPNAIYVALVASRRNFQDHLKLCTKEKSDLKKTL